MKKTKVVLITMYGYQNAGIRHLTAILKKNRYPVRTIFMKKWINNNIKPPTDKEKRLLRDLVADFKPNLIGIGFGSPYYKIVRELVEKYLKTLGAKIILGGIHPTLVPEKCIEFADFVCLGEGELPLLELVDSLEEGKKVDNIKSLWVKKGDNIIKNPPRPLIRNLDSIPFRDFSDEEKFYIENNKIYKGDPLKGSAILRVHASRGCPFHCAYCYNSSLRAIYSGAGNYHRRRSVENVIEEIKEARKFLPKIKRIKFDDDTFVFPKKWLDEFCEKYPKEIGLPFDILLNPSVIWDDYLRKLKKIGLENVQIGIQSASESETQDFYDRYLGNEDILHFAKLNKLLKLDVVYDIIMDNPLATKQDKEILIDFLLNLPRPFKIYLYSLTIFPKSAVAEKLLKRGLITEKDIEGEATKSFRQFRLTLSYPRKKEDVFYISLIVLITKNFIPKKLIRFLWKSKYFRENPELLKIFSQVSNLIKMSFIALKMMLRGELTWFKLKEYASLKRMITQ